MLNCPLIGKECEKEECIFWCPDTNNCKLVLNCAKLNEIVEKLNTIISNQVGG